jgi:hypothetical protein
LRRFTLKRVHQRPDGVLPIDGDADLGHRHLLGNGVLKHDQVVVAKLRKVQGESLGSRKSM